MGRKAFRRAKIAAGVIAAVYALVYADLVLRARSAYLEGEKYIEWHRDPAKKKAHFDAIYEKEVAALEVLKRETGMAGAEYAQRLELEAFRRDEAVSESSLKYAYHWYKTAVDLFSPPESRWVRLSRTKMAEAKTLWKAELDAKGIPYEDYMLE